jgi:hypothetical protein
VQRLLLLRFAPKLYSVALRTLSPKIDTYTHGQSSLGSIAVPYGGHRDPNRFAGIACLFVAEGDRPFRNDTSVERILTVALYPVFNRLARLIGSKMLAAATITVLSLMIVLGPVVWLGLAMIGGIELLVRGIDTGQLAIPMPPDALRTWPLIGEKTYQIWSQAVTNTEAILLQRRADRSMRGRWAGVKTHSLKNFPSASLTPAPRGIPICFRGVPAPASTLSFGTIEANGRFLLKHPHSH